MRFILARGYMLSMVVGLVVVPGYLLMMTIGLVAGYVNGLHLEAGLQLYSGGGIMAIRKSLQCMDLTA